MTTNVSFTEFRNKLTDYIELLKSGAEVVIKDAKKDKEIVTLVAKKEEEFDWDEHMEFLKNFKPFWTKDDDARLKKLRNIDKKRAKSLNW